MKNKTDIVCLSTTCFRERPTRKQAVMTRIDGGEILYFDPPVTLLAPLKDKNAWKAIKRAFKKGDRVSENITVYALPPVLPFYNKVRFINRINQFFLSRYVKARIRRHNFERPLVWVYHPMYFDCARHISKSGLVYDCVDRHSGYPGMINVELVDSMERELCAACRAVFATSKGLFDRLLPSNPNTYYIPNGANFELFNSAAGGNLPCPPELEALPRPIFGFVGMLQDCIDYDCIEALAKANPDASVVLVGEPLPGVDISQIKKYSNVHLLGVRPHGRLPEYIAQFDVCLNPFKTSSLSRDVSPLKFYEYLCTGKPIVSTAQPDQVLAFEDCVYIARSPEDFAKKCALALSDNSQDRTGRRIAYGRSASWDDRVKDITSICKGRGILS